MTVTVIHVPDRVEIQSFSIFLAGPTPRSKDVKSWRPDFIERLKQKNIDCTVLVPETVDWDWCGDFEKQCEWEYDHLHKADCIVFWVPRDLETLPGFTTNVEFGYWVSKDGGCKVLYGRPEGTVNIKYLDWMYEKETGREPVNRVNLLINSIIEFKKEL